MSNFDRLKPIDFSNYKTDLMLYNLKYFSENADKRSPTPRQFLLFYKFINLAYLQNKRPSVSQVGAFLEKSGFENPGTLAVLYAHGLYILALKENKKVYGEDFNP